MKRGIRIECTVCGQMKQPRGRSAPLEARYCDRECPGYDQAPHVGALWPGETDVDFGYPCSDTGTEPVLGPEQLTPACRMELVSQLLAPEYVETCPHCGSEAVRRGEPLISAEGALQLLEGEER